MDDPLLPALRAASEPLAALTLQTFPDLASEPPLRALLFAGVREAASALGLRGSGARALAYCRARSGRGDLARGNPSRALALLAGVLRSGRRRGTPMPVLETQARILKLLKRGA
jgi:ketopantoate reductase